MNHFFTHTVLASFFVARDGLLVAFVCLLVEVPLAGGPGSRRRRHISADTITSHTWFKFTHTLSTSLFLQGQWKSRVPNPNGEARIILGKCQITTSPNQDSQ